MDIPAGPFSLAVPSTRTRANYKVREATLSDSLSLTVKLHEGERWLQGVAADRFEHEELMMIEDGLMRIGELGRPVGVDPATLRFYESVAVLPKPERTPAEYRSYGPADADRLRFVAWSLGLSLDDVREILGLRDRGEAPCVPPLPTRGCEVSPWSRSDRASP